jgi:hypothetical protein
MLTEVYEREQAEKHVKPQIQLTLCTYIDGLESQKSDNRFSIDKSERLWN